MGPHFADDARAVLDARFAAREKAITGSRRVIRSSANGIRSLHRGEWEAASELIGQAGAELAEITEVSEGGSVPQLTVLNNADTDALILDGTELEGAKQDRMVNITGPDVPGPGSDLGGMSGGPVFLMRDLVYPLVGVVTDFSPTWELLRVSHLGALAERGRLTWPCRRRLVRS